MIGFVRNAIGQLFGGLGRVLQRWALGVTTLIAMLGQVQYALLHLRHRSRRRVLATLLRRQLTDTVFQSALINSLLAVLVGAALGDTLLLVAKRIEDYMSLITFVLVEELAPIISGIILIMRSGSGRTLQIGYMHQQQEDLVLRRLGIDPVFILALPTMCVFPISLLLMTFYFIGIALTTAWLATQASDFGHWTLPLFLGAIIDSFSIAGWMALIVKTVLGGWIIGAIALASGAAASHRMTELPSRLALGTTWSLFIFLVLCLVVSAVQRL